MSSTKQHKILIGGGGTGGHIYPAIAVARALQEIESTIEILFVGAEGKMEMQKIPAAGFKIIGLPVAGIARKLSAKNFLVPFKFLRSVFMAKKIIRDFKPDAIIGFGGYASAPLLFASSRKIPLFIHEGNSFAGLTNKWLGKKVRKIFVAHEGMGKYFPSEKIIITGNPVRRDLVQSSISNEEGKRFFNLNPGRKTILVIGGSLGARGINHAVGSSFAGWNKNNFQLIWQTGKPQFELLGNLYSNNPSVFIAPFIENMAMAYAAADVIVSRAGAISIAELSLIGKPVILIPSPFVAEDHQTKNAEELARKESAIMIHEKEATEKLGNAVSDILKQENVAASLSASIGFFARPEADQSIAEEILSQIKQGGK